MAEIRGRDGGGQELNVESAFIGVGCNKVVGAAAWGPCNLVAYAAHHLIAIFDPQVGLFPSMVPQFFFKLYFVYCK
jgi:elongator complex protein 2